MLLSHHQNIGRNRDIKISNRSFENVSQFKYLGTTITNQHVIQEDLHDLYSSPSMIRIIKSRDGRVLYREWGRRGTYIGYWWENQRERD
jgi:hypothetical protein